MKSKKEKNTTFSVFCFELFLPRLINIHSLTLSSFPRAAPRFSSPFTHFPSYARLLSSLRFVLPILSVVSYQYPLLTSCCVACKATSRRLAFKTHSPTPRLTTRRLQPFFSLLIKSTAHRKFKALPASLCQGAQRHCSVGPASLLSTTASRCALIITTEEASLCGTFSAGTFSAGNIPRCHQILCKRRQRVLIHATHFFPSCLVYLITRPL